MLLSLLAFAANAATLPGVSIPFDIDEEGRWVLSSDLPANLADAGAQPGWILREVDGMAFDNPTMVQLRVASGPARNIQLLFAIPQPEGEGIEEPPPEDGAEEEEAVEPELPEAILVARRSPLVLVEEVAFMPWPEGLQPPVKAWQEDWAGSAVLIDSAQDAWILDEGAGGLFRSNAGEWTEHSIPDVFWGLSSATWAFLSAKGVERGDVGWARERLQGAARRASFRGEAGDHLVIQEDDGLRVWSMSWPRGTPSLPTCQPRVPETCLTSGMQILADLGERPGAQEEAMRHLGLACANGVHRACYESVALEDPSTAPQVESCIGGDVTACNKVAADRLAFDPEQPEDLVLGLLEYACELEGSGTLGERLRRLEDVGQGCILLSNAYDARGMPDLALLNLDQACVIGRADACEEAAERRHQAFAARTVRECEDPDLPIATSCVDLGKLLQQGEVPVATVDDFGAFLRGCTLGAVDGCILLGDYVDRWGIEHVRVQEAESQLLGSCAEGEQRACVGAAHLLVRHEPRTEAYGKALSLFSSSCEAGLGEGCVAGAEQRRIGYARKVEAPSQVELWTSACDRHDAVGCAGLGERLARSKPELESAFTAYERSCELGHASACSQLGQLVERRHDPAWPGEQPSDAYLERGCTNGDPEGCFWLAEDALPRKGEPPEQTYLLLDQSCEGEYGPGCAQLATVHLERKTNFDEEIAARHLDTACDNGHYDSCRILGGMYLRGRGVDRDRQKANELLERFRLNARRRHLRVGAALGLPYGAGGELELVLPIPVGPAISLGGNAAYLPKAGTVLMLVKGEGEPNVAPDLQILGASGRLYPNPQGRGLYGAIGVHQLVATGGDLGDDLRVRAGWNWRMGIRSQTNMLYTSLEIGMGQFGNLVLADFEEGEPGAFPIVLPALGFSVGLALL